MKLAFHRRTIRIPRWIAGETIVLKIPATSAVKSDLIALLLHVWRLSRLSPDQISALYSTRLSSMACGTIIKYPRSTRNYPATVEGYLQYLRDHGRRRGSGGSGIGSRVVSTSPRDDSGRGSA